MTSTAELDSMSDAYDEVHLLDNRLTHEWYPQRVMSAAKGSSLLELGLGHGESTSLFAQHFPRYCVVEGSPEMIKRFRGRFKLPEVDIVCGYFEDFDTDERFDNIGMGFVLEHVDDPALVLRRFMKFLKPGGSIFAAVPNCESLHRRIGQAAGLLPDLTHLSEGDLRFGHQRYFSLKTFTELFVNEGCEVVKAEGLMLKPVTTGQLMQLDLSPAILQGLMKVGVDYPELSNSILLQARLRTAT
nr:class I SAM-dependent methyltransferase [uncultured Roseateles sp.]